MNVIYIVGYTTVYLILLFETVNSIKMETHYGTIQGRRNLAPNGRRVKEFLGVPFAKPPVAELRFKPPIELEKWSGTINTTKLSYSCMQKTHSITKFLPLYKPYDMTTPMSEDCLHLNMWLPDCDDCTNLAVMIFFYGGGYYLGSNSAPAYDGGVLATEERVIVVVPNYRLGSFGFLSLDNKEIPGNAGLFDQQMAMKWVYENIQKFGGDPKRIVIYGQSAGGSSVNFHLVAPSSWKYFNGAILQSGFINNHWAITLKNKNDNYSKDLASFLNCNKPNVTETLLCLQKKDAQEIVNNEPVIESRLGIFMPVIDGVFLTEHPFKSYSTRRIKSCNIIAGLMKNEATFLLSRIIPEFILPFSKDPKPPFESIFSLLKKFPVMEKKPFLIKIFEYVYNCLRETDDYSKIIFTLEKIISDSFFTCAMKKLLDPYVHMTNGSLKIYSYLLSYRASFVKTNHWLGVVHGSDLPFIFGHPLNTLRFTYHEGNVSLHDVQLSKRIMRYWANFARSGNPSVSPSGQMEVIEWPAYTAFNEEYLILRPNSTMVGLNYRSKYCVFQNELVPSLINDFDKFRDTQTQPADINSENL